MIVLSLPGPFPGQLLECPFQMPCVHQASFSLHPPLYILNCSDREYLLPPWLPRASALVLAYDGYEIVSSVLGQALQGQQKEEHGLWSLGILQFNATRVLHVMFLGS